MMSGDIHHGGSSSPYHYDGSHLVNQVLDVADRIEEQKQVAEKRKEAGS